MKSIKNHFVEKKARKEVLTKFDDVKIDALIKIEGTDFDRKRKYDSFTVSLWRKDYESGMSFGEIAKKYNASFHAVRYNLDENWRKYYNEHRDGRHTGVDVCTFENRVNYKKYLVRSKKIKVANIVL